MKSRYPLILISIISLMLFSSTAHSQFFEELTKPKLEIPLTHPPMLNLTISKVAFGPSSGQGSDQLINDLISDFTSNNIQVMDRQDLNTILSEHNLSLSGYIDPNTASAIGKLIGPSALIIIDITRDQTTQQESYDNEKEYNPNTKSYYYATAYFSTTRAFLEGSVRVVDLTTGRIFASQPLNFSPQKANKSFQGYPVYPAPQDLEDAAITQAKIFIDHMFLPWKEMTTLYYFNDKAGGLREAFEALKAGDEDGAFNLSRQNLENDKNDHKIKHKTLGHAYYNMGMSYMFRNQFDSAMEDFRQANQLSSGEIIQQAMAECEKKQELTASMEQVEQKASIAAATTQAAADSTAQSEAANTLNNAEIIEMTKERLPYGIIIAKIKHSKCDFDTSPKGLGKLTRAGVNEKVIEAMIQ